MIVTNNIILLRIIVIYIFLLLSEEKVFLVMTGKALLFIKESWSNYDNIKFFIIDKIIQIFNLCIKIGYSSREPRRVIRPCNKIGYVSAMY